MQKEPGEWYIEGDPGVVEIRHRAARLELCKNDETERIAAV